MSAVFANPKKAIFMKRKHLSLTYTILSKNDGSVLRSTQIKFDPEVFASAAPLGRNVDESQGWQIDTPWSEAASPVDVKGQKSKVRVQISGNLISVLFCISHAKMTTLNELSHILQVYQIYLRVMFIVKV